MIRISNKIIDVINYGRTSIQKVYHKVNGEMKMLWELVAGCFTKGFWINNRGWTNDKGWKNN